MEIKTAKYMKSSFSATNDSIHIDTGEKKTVGERTVKMVLSVPIVEDNTDYIEIMKLVDEGKLTIDPAEE